MTAARSTLSLDGRWEFALDDERATMEPQSRFMEEITVPGCWQAQGFYGHTGWYRRSFSVPEEWQDKKVWLKFGGVSYDTQVWVNGQFVLHHEGLFLPFQQEISAYLRFGADNQIVVRVTQFDYPNVFQTEQLGDTLLGVYGCWTTWGGIFQSVTLETTSATWIDNVFLIPDIDTGIVTAQIRLQNTADQVGDFGVSVRVRPQVGSDVFEASSSAVVPANGQTVIEIAVPLSDVTLWHPDHPFLYSAEVMLWDDRQVVDSISDRFGMRKVEIRGQQILLNHEPIFLLGWLDDAVFPDQISPTLTEADVRELLGRCKEYGFNFVRHHTHIPVPIFHQVADELGVLQLEEFASFGSIGRPRIDPTQKTRQQIFETWRGMIERDHNHPSIIAYGVNNECWSEHEFLTWAPIYRDLYHLGKSLDPTRIIIDNSGGEDHWSAASDIYDKHIYQFPTEQEMKRITDGRSYRVYIPKREAYFNVDLSTIDKPCLVTEVGGWCSFPDFEKIRARNQGRTPWWLSRDPLVNPRMAHALINRMEEGMAQAGIADLYPTIVNNSEHYAGMANKLQVEHMRQVPGIAGYAYCTFTDCYNWGAGIVDNYLQAKSHAPDFARINQPSILLWPHNQWCFRAGEEINITPAISHYGRRSIENGTLRWRLLENETVLVEGQQENVSIASYQVCDLDTIELTLPHLPHAAKLRLKLTLTDKNHHLQNDWNVWVFPAIQIDPHGPIVRLFDPDQTQTRWTTLFPFIQPADEGENAASQVLITTRLTENVIAYLEAGGNVLWLQSGSELSCRPYEQEPAVDYHAAIVNDHPITAAFPHEGWCDLQFHHLIGTAALDTGYFDSQKLTPIIEVFHMAYWLQNPRILPFRRKGLLAEAQVGQGRLLTTTFAFEREGDYPEIDAMAQIVLVYLLAPSGDTSSVLSGDDLREWVWGSVHGAAETNFVPFMF